MYHSQSVNATAQQLSTSITEGLSEKTAQARLERYGENRLSEGKKKSVVRLFLDQLNDPLIYILIIAAVISGIMGELSDTIIIALVVMLNAVIGVSQEAKAEKAMAALKQMAAPKAYVIRDGITRETDAAYIVPGDLVVLDAGRLVPCDIRLCEGVGLQAEESALTGESVPVYKEAELILEAEQVPLGDQKNMVFSSTLITSGRGLGIATATGMETQIGHIADMLQQTGEKTPLQQKLAQISRLLGIVALVVCAAMFLTAVLQQRDLFEMFLTAVSLAVAAIPEGMPAIVTIVLATGVQRMAKRNAIIRKLPSVETLGSVNVICSDKTGTLTQNRMTVQQFYVNGKEVAAAELDPEEGTQRLLLEAMVLCSDATSDESGSTGDPTEIALLDAAAAHNVWKDSLVRRHERVAEAPFDSGRKLMSTVNQYGDQFYVMTKGAADQLLQVTDRLRLDGEIVPMTEMQRQEILDAAGRMSDQALRVLGIAYKEMHGVPGDQQGMEQQLVFLGLAAMIDPPRLEVKESIDTCLSAGIQTVMITGDHQKTALAIATELGIARSQEQVMAGVELDKYSDEELAERVKRVRVFARVSPEHKVRIVKAFRAGGNIVSMTGDGVNDAPSLKAADIGVAMGVTGTDVAKGAADMILTDDNFATIVTAVAEGRNIYANIRKAILFLLSCNIGEIISLFAATLLGWATPLLSIHLLWVNLITDSFPALALGADPGDRDIMKEKPRDAKAGLFEGKILYLVLNGGLIGLLTLLAFAIGAMRHTGVWSLTVLSMDNLQGEVLSEAQTMAFIVLSVSQLFHSLNLRHDYRSIFSIGLFTNKYLIGAIVLGILIQLAVIVIDPVATIFKVVQLDLTDWGIVIGLSSMTLMTNEAVKFIRRHAG